MHGNAAAVFISGDKFVGEQVLDEREILPVKRVVPSSLELDERLLKKRFHDLPVAVPSTH